MAEPIDIAFINATIGPEEIGVIFGAWMFGLFTVQTFNYYNNFPNDSKKMKWTVAILWVLELIHVILSCVALYHATVLTYGEPEQIEFIHKALSLSLIISTIVGPGVQIFFADRVRRLSGRWPLTIFCWFLSFIRALTLLGVCIATYTNPHIPSFVGRFKWLILTSLAVSTSADIIIAVALCYLLWQRRGDGRESTQKVVDTLIAWSINTGLLTSVASILMLLFFVLMANFAWVCMMLVIPRLFANSMLASLNSRTLLRKARDVNPSTSSNTPRVAYPGASIAIEMTKTREIMTDQNASRLDLGDKMMVYDPERGMAKSSAY